MSFPLQLSGQKFERLLVIEVGVPHRAKGGALIRRWRCICDCGNECVIPGQRLVTGMTRSCGCLHRELISRGNMERLTTHGGSYTPEYSIWRGMLKRCMNPKNKDYCRYGSRGIQVCERWKASFADFIGDVGWRPNPKLSIDRINNGGNYEPGNCRWATVEQQNANRRTKYARRVYKKRNELAAIH